MSNILILSPLPVSSVATSRGTGATSLLTPDPKEAWRGTITGESSTIDIDLGVARTIDTIFLGYVQPPAEFASWAITGGVNAYDAATLKPAGPLRVSDAAGQFPDISFALWRGSGALVRYLRLVVTQPWGPPLLSIGVLMVGKAFVPSLNKEWGSGRRPIDTGTATPLPSGGFAIVEGARKRVYSWTLGDLTDAEIETLDAIALDRGETRPALVVEDPATTSGLHQRIHYGLMRWRAFERRSRNRTKWELEIEEWV